MKRVLITGINGFIGHSMSELLKDKKEYEICGVGRGTVSREQITYVSCDIASDDFVRKMSRSMEPCDIIIHAAASVDFRAYEECLRTNSIGTYHVCELAELWQSSQMIYLSSVPVIGVPLDIPVTEEHVVRPNTMYHLSKYFGEQMMPLAMSRRIRQAILRIPSPIGRGMNMSSIVGVFLRRCLENKDLTVFGQGGRSQNYIDVRDLCASILCAVEKEADGLYLVAGGHSISNLELARKCIEVSGADSGIIFKGEDPEEDLQWEISVEKARKELGYVPEYSLEESLKWIYEGMCSRG